MNIVKATEQNIQKAADIIKNGGLVAFPTETVYGLGGNGLNPLSVAGIFEAKKRPSFDPLILHISDKDQLSQLCTIESKNTEILMDKFWPGPLTLVLPKKEIVPSIVTSGNPTVAVRMPSNPIAAKFIDACGLPVAAPSANLFNRLSPTTAEHVYEQLGNSIDLILDGGNTTVGVESTIVELKEDKAYLLRYGGTPAEAIEIALGQKLLTNQHSAKPNAPGQLPYHYSPTTPIKFIDDELLNNSKALRVGALLFSGKEYNFDFTTTEFLSRNKDFKEAAANLFLKLHILEKENLDLIAVEKLPEEGLGCAIMDRLKKATAKYS